MQSGLRSFATDVITALAVTALALPLCAISAQPDPHAGPAMNYHVIDNRLATGGHLTDGGLETLAAGGLQVVIDLREEPPPGHAKALADQDIEYVHVPVSWEKPQPEDFERFREALNKHRARQVLVQCAANYRASAMTYLYRTRVERVSEAEAAGDLHAVWTPNPTWQKFFDSVRAVHPD